MPLQHTLALCALAALLGLTRGALHQRELRLACLELFVAHLDLELAKKLTHLRRVLDLLHHTWCEERREVRLAKALGHGRHGLASKRGESGRMASFEQTWFGRPAHERVAPIEQDSRKHEPDTLPAL